MLPISQGMKHRQFSWAWESERIKFECLFHCEPVATLGCPESPAEIQCDRTSPGYCVSACMWKCPTQCLAQCRCRVKTDFLPPFLPSSSLCYQKEFHLAPQLVLGWTFLVRLFCGAPKQLLYQRTALHKLHSLLPQSIRPLGSREAQEHKWQGDPWQRVYSCSSS